MKRAAFFVLFLLVSLFSISQNLVTNAGFENWEKSTRPVGWTTAQNCLKDSLYIHFGTYSCRHDGGTKYLGQTITVIPGKHYLLSFFYKTVITGTGNGCRIWCYWKDLNGNNLADLLTDDILRPSKYLKSDSWQQFSADFSAPVGSASIYLEVRTYANSITYYDDFVFETDGTTNIPEDKVSEIKIYPNPASDYLTICNTNKNKIESISLQTLSGITLWYSASPGMESVLIPVSNLLNGKYIISIRTSGKVITRKIIINR
jgi:hypothetical protein